MCANCKETQTVYPATRAPIGSKIICLYCEAPLAVRGTNGTQAVWLWQGNVGGGEARVPRP